MTVQLKQRIVGIIVLLFLGLIILPILFGHDPNMEKKTENNNTTTINLATESSSNPNSFSAEQHLEKKPVTSSLPVPDEETQQNTSTQPVADTTVQKLQIPTSDKNKNLMKIENNIINQQKHTTYPPQSSKEITEESNVIKKLTVTKPQNKTKTTQKASQKSDVDNVSSSVAKTSDTALQLDEPKIKKVSALTVKDSGKKWSVQLGSFSNRANADSLIKKLKANGFKVYSKVSINSDGKEISRVFVGPETLHAKAATDVQQLKKKLHLQGVIVKK